MALPLWLAARTAAGSRCPPRTGISAAERRATDAQTRRNCPHRSAANPRPRCMQGPIFNPLVKGQTFSGTRGRAHRQDLRVRRSGPGAQRAGEAALSVSKEGTVGCRVGGAPHRRAPLRQRRINIMETNYIEEDVRRRRADQDVDARRAGGRRGQAPAARTRRACRSSSSTSRRCPTCTSASARPSAR